MINVIVSSNRKWSEPRLNCHVSVVAPAWRSEDDDISQQPDINFGTVQKELRESIQRSGTSDRELPQGRCRLQFVAGGGGETEDEHDV